MPRIDRSSVIHGALALFAVGIIGKAAHVQLWQREQWLARAAQQHFAGDTLPAPRGVITDASGRVLVESRELVRLRIAPRELKDRARIGRLLARAKVPNDWVRRAVDTTRKWVEIPGTFLPTDVAAVTAERGVHQEPVIQRVASGTEGVLRIVGRVGADGAPVDGVELALDSLLRGVRGTTMLLRDGRGGRLESPFTRNEAARPGHGVTLTINAALQDICERALADAAKQMGATGGDIVVMNPFDGEVLALASLRPDPRTTSATTLTEPFEPGSTMKPLVAARLLELKRAKPDEVIGTENGEYTINGRTIHDDEPAKELSLRDVIRVSSNIGIVKFSQRLTVREEFELLRDLGFGSPTGVPYPAEARGIVRAPKDWTPQSAASMVMGYEVAVTPLQLATAYSAVANGGRLLEPALVRDIRDADGEIVWRHTPRVVRQVMSPKTAGIVREMLKAVVDSGTSTAANLASFTLVGKSGTARRVERGRGYVAGHYNAVFASIFPMEDPQYVIVVKLENPAGDVYFGGKTAGPVTKAVLQAALAARDAALNRAALAERVLPAARDAYTPKVAVADTLPPPTPAAAPIELRRDRLEADTVASGVVRYVVDLPGRRVAAVPVSPPRAVPAGQGLPLRDAIYALHRAGFRVKLAPGGDGRTVPAAGAVAPAGTAVTLYRDP
jgi:cell division protein FtsI (penicillin-binding protein 3)